MRKSRPWFMLLLALTSGVVAALLALRYLRERTTPLMAAEPKRVNIVLSARNLPVGAVVTDRDVKLVSWPGDALPSGYIRSTQDAVGREDIAAVSPRTSATSQAKMSTKDAGGGPHHHPGRHARGQRPSGRGDRSGRIRDSGYSRRCHVDPGQGAHPSPAITKTLLQNVQTLAAGQSVTRDKEGKPQTVTVITLLVTPDDGELLALAAKEGRLQLALRNTLDTLSVSTSGARADRLSPAAASSQNSRPQRNRAVAPVPKANPTVVEGYRGGERTLTTFQRP